MIDSDQRPDSNWHPLTALPQITVQTQTGIHWRHYLKSRSNLRVFSNRRPFQILRSIIWTVYWLGLGHMSVTSLDVDLRKWDKAIDLRIWKKRHRFENWTPIWEFEKKDIDLRYRCLWHRNRTWVWEVDVDLSLIYIYTRCGHKSFEIQVSYSYNKIVQSEHSIYWLQHSDCLFLHVALQSFQFSCRSDIQADKIINYKKKILNSNGQQYHQYQFYQKLHEVQTCL